MFGGWQGTEFNKYIWWYVLFQDGIQIGTYTINYSDKIKLN